MTDLKLKMPGNIATKDREIWTAQEVAAYLRCTARHVTACAARKELPGVRIGNVWRFRRRDIEGLFEEKAGE